MTSFSISLSGLQAAQKGLDNVSHNIANANTPNFKKVETLFKEVSYGNQPGGVTTSSVRANYPWLDTQLKQATATFLENTATAEYTDLLVRGLTSPSVADAYQEVVNAASALTHDSANVSLKQDFIEKNRIFADAVTSLQKNLDNVGIAMGFERKTLLLENESYANNPEMVDVIAANNAKIAGIDKVKSGIYGTAKETLKTLTGAAVDFINSTNGTPVLSYNGNPAELSVIVTNPNQISIHLDDLASSENTPLVNGMSIKDTWGTLQVKLGAASNLADTGEDMAQTAIDSAQSAFDSAYGVDLAEEMVKNMRYAALYEANMKMIKTQDDLLGTLLSIRS